MKKVSLALLTAISLFMTVPSNVGAVPMFARMYSYNCTMCHYPAYGQLNKFGWEFRDAGFRLPSEISQKDPNDGKFEMGNYLSIRASGGFSATSKSNAPIVAGATSGPPVSDNASFTFGSPSLFMGGPIGKNYTAFIEFSLGNGTGIFPGTAPSASIAFVGYTTGDEHNYLTVRVGKFPNIDGFAGSDRGPVGNPAMNSTINGAAIKATATGAEIGYTMQDTRFVLGFFNGIQSPIATDLYDKGKPVTTTSLIGNTSDTNNAKDICLFINQFIGEDGADVNLAIYNGFNGSGFATPAVGAIGDAAGSEFYRIALWATAPIVKNLEIKAGGVWGQNFTGLFASNDTASSPVAGAFGELNLTLNDLTPLAIRYDYTTPNAQLQYQETQKVTMGALTPLIENVYLNPQYSLTMTSAPLGTTYTHSLSTSMNVIF